MIRHPRHTCGWNDAPGASSFRSCIILQQMKHPRQPPSWRPRTESQIKLAQNKWPARPACPRRAATSMPVVGIQPECKNHEDATSHEHSARSQQSLVPSQRDRFSLGRILSIPSSAAGPATCRAAQAVPLAHKRQTCHTSRWACRGSAPTPVGTKNPPPRPIPTGSGLTREARSSPPRHRVSGVCQACPQAPPWATSAGP